MHLPGSGSVKQTTARRQRFRRFARYLLQHPSATGKVARFLYRRYHAWLAAYHAWANTRSHQGVVPIDPFAIIWADPARIERWVRGIRGVRWRSWRKLGSVEDGGWDENTGLVADLGSHIGLYERFAEGKPWQETELYRSVAVRLAQGRVEWGCLTIDQFAARCAEIDRLHEAILKFGYKSQKQLLQSERKDDPITHIHLDEKLRAVDEIAVGIGRTGELLLADGQHRLTLAKILSIPLVPVRVVIRHAEWQRFREDLARHIATALHGQLPHPLPHPDLNWQGSLFPSIEWFEAVTAHTGVAGGTLLEVNASISGYFASRFERQGFRCTALEPDPGNASWLTRVRDASQDRFEIIGSHETLHGRSFDLVLWIAPANVHGNFRGTVERLAALTKSELYIAQPVVEAAAGGPNDLRPGAAGSLLLEQLGFASCTIIESALGTDYALVRAARSPVNGLASDGQRGPVRAAPATSWTFGTLGARPFHSGPSTR